jgi:hypothetical protein
MLGTEKLCRNVKSKNGILNMEEFTKEWRKAKQLKRILSSPLSILIV